ncbi:MAG: NADH-quinone oxidoreductase subunit A [Bacteroidota bacterium]
MAEISGFGHILLFLLGGIGFTLLGIATNRLLAPNRPNPEKLTTYECGEDPVGNASIQFNLRFYLIGLVFLIFEVELLFFFPWATVFAEESWIAALPDWGIFALIEMLIFALVLFLGLVYVWVKGDLEWVKPAPLSAEIETAIPDTAYEQVNQRY